MLNRLHNATNPNQGYARRVLCVCSAGLLRSPTAANVLHTEYGFNTRAVGIDTQHALIPLDNVLLHWADEIVVMDTYQEKAVSSRLTSLTDHKPIQNLSIPDLYSYMQDELVELIKELYKVSYADEKTTKRET